MGSQSVKPITNKTERKVFINHLLNDIEALDMMIKSDAFEKGIQRIGAEQEFCIVDQYYRPSFNALEILAEINDVHFTTELGLFNLEANLDPLELKGTCFSQLEKDLSELVEKAIKAADAIDFNKIILTGILPTFKRKDLVFENMTPFQRYKVLNDVMKKVRGNNFRVKVRGVDELILDHESILFEACNTSFQVHLQIDLDDIVDQYNWSQAIAGPILSVMTNSPMLLGRELWSETRIALFQQSIDLRNRSQLLREQKARVNFGNDWIKDSIIEVFTDDVSRYAPLVTSELEGNPIEDLKNGIKPELKAIGLHNGTLYKWNRVCYGVHKNVAHLRIENRYIPSGPSIKDEIANAMFWIGVMLGMPEDCKSIWKRMAFKDAKGNFIKAARTGLDTYFNWFGKGVSAKKLAKKILLPMAHDGLLKANINIEDIEFYLNIIKERIDKNTTGSKWLVRSSRMLQEDVSREEANILLTYHMHKNQQENLPVSEWELAKPLARKDASSNDKVHKVMSTQIFTVHENDSMRLIKNIMQWKDINHIPVINEEHKIVGIISTSDISNVDKFDDHSASQVMQKDIKYGTPDMHIEEAKSIMLENNIRCLPIIDHNELVGILTKTDLEKLNS
ncbi:CBS domain-containing protein [Psychroserpens ponticola]|uniref:CBS domain-containing protein n=1 Tax=Psychroserpens ponticola TaxID=2932268 RepID=A0ABY7RUA4_9FLAO|nr:CBS domain-containing protein [Psychroserpens ponticola]WCO00701.1 CBS domain-containing protein [Psychroserpens ponticola]